LEKKKRLTSSPLTKKVTLLSVAGKATDVAAQSARGLQSHSGLTMLFRLDKVDGGVGLSINLIRTLRCVCVTWWQGGRIINFELRFIGECKSQRGKGTDRTLVRGKQLDFGKLGKLKSVDAEGQDARGVESCRLKEKLSQPPGPLRIDHKRPWGRVILVMPPMDLIVTGDVEEKGRIPDKNWRSLIKAIASMSRN